MKWQNEIDRLLRNMPAHRRVIVLQRALRFARAEARGQEQMWREIAKEDIDCDDYY